MRRPRAYMDTTSAFGPLQETHGTLNARSQARSSGDRLLAAAVKPHWNKILSARLTVHLALARFCTVNLLQPFGGVIGN